MPSAVVARFGISVLGAVEHRILWSSMESWHPDRFVSFGDSCAGCCCCCLLANGCERFVVDFHELG